MHAVTFFYKTHGWQTKMLRFLARKIPSVMVVALISSMIAFILPRFAPGDPAVAIAGSEATPEQLAAVRAELGLDQPLVLQYWDWLAGVFQGDLGMSLITKRPVSELILSGLESTLELTLLATILMITVGLVLGVLGGAKSTGLGRLLLDVVTTIFLATPPFLTGLILIVLLGIVTPILPVSGEVLLSEDFVEGLKYLILPALALAIPQGALVARLLQTTMTAMRNEDFVDLAKAKGVRPGLILRRHVLRNSWGPAVVAIGLRIGDLLAGAIVVEAIFARNGLGSLAVLSVQSRDYFVLQALILGAVIIAVVIQLLCEIILATLDPRIRLEG